MPPPPPRPGEAPVGLPSEGPNPAEAAVLLENWTRFAAEALESGGSSPAPSLGSSSGGSTAPDYPSAGLRGDARASYLSELAHAQEAVDEMVSEIPYWGEAYGAHRLASLQRCVRAMARWIAVHRFGSSSPA
jgi:hypothetical protein